MKNELFAIGIPTINRADLLNYALKRYLDDFPDSEFYIVDNGEQAIIEHPRIKTHKAAQNYGVARSWNELCKSIFRENYPYAVILNDDIYLGRKEWEIKDCIFKNIDESFLANTGTWCSFIMPVTTFNSVGDFDENFFPAYFEDNDYAYRLKLSGKSFFPTSVLAPVEYRNSMSIAKDSTLNRGFETNKQYYIKKWGGMPTQEIYQCEFNKSAST